MLFYIEDPKRRQGGLMCLWAIGDCGYTTMVMAARIFSEGEVAAKCSVKIDDKIAWPRYYIMERTKGGSVSIDDCDIEEAWKV